ncbi:NUDIX domain-containing protein [Streptomyces iconiensis]|uniref:NUDIX hydrolase n=1 Tax=Streptomyces iconiensis TaxID=1384038 RepID=A0ABT6ZX23_9ACTN|nr:NUDIX hydrolase [Streptomyces iconiensis]MDJ1133615.1 NUDIX hydrolase [Streptomyces iconiensis]
MTAEHEKHEKHEKHEEHEEHGEHEEHEEKEAARAYLAGLPRTRGAACALLLDGHGCALLVRPTYRPGWLLPGGVIESGESPLAACRREIGEEIGVPVSLSGLIGLDWIPPREGRDASQVFVFGGRLGEEAPNDIRLPPEELSEHRFVMASELHTLLFPHVVRRVTECWKEYEAGGTAYLEHGFRVASLSHRESAYEAMRETTEETARTTAYKTADKTAYKEGCETASAAARESFHESWPRPASRPSVGSSGD